MADNRIYLTCAICGERLYLGGSSGKSGVHYESLDRCDLAEKLNNFYQGHIRHDELNNWLGTNFYIEHESFSKTDSNAVRKFYESHGLFDCN